MARTTYILYACVGLGNSGSCKIYGAYNGQPNTCVKSAHAQHWPAAVPIAIGNAHRANHQNNLKSLWGQINKSPSLLPLISGSEPEGQPQQALQGCAGPAHKELVRCERVDEVQAAAQDVPVVFSTRVTCSWGVVFQKFNVRKCAEVPEEEVATEKEAKRDGEEGKGPKAAKQGGDSVEEEAQAAKKEEEAPEEESEAPKKANKAAEKESEATKKEEKVTKKDKSKKGEKGQ
eukprot:1160987-Pelagomonas_calceolata.AAC.14